MAFNFKNAEDVEAYLKNIYTEYRFGCESEKNPNACHLLGDYLEGITRDFEKAAETFKSNCDERNWPRSCAKYGGYVGVGCELGDGIGCVKAGLLATSPRYKFLDNRAEQVALGMKMLSKGCFEHDRDEGCFYLSGIFLGGLKDDVEPNLTEAYKLSIKSCEAGNPYACANLSQMHARGEGAEKNESLAELFKERALVLHKELKKVQKQIEFGQGIDV
ncbi:Similar to Coa7: Cytochrome c oxidase assembly factor 7 homolog (Drosophila melanogaster) [Cotesia congregata]|uniref:Similar to Coa7: Cytochrome c oxidase assembly factor 7 homolog (Drosophila melanogaster) n=1 Tax=Cotesia congregata TaxID=51543 RepID=A0A8J2E7W2_COTCN|nr:Similar to Coa7: Cytochrome c oxidase assembly factor 7 homolog (Drosophila melanogaster) [Cotesia congregata]